MLLGLIRLFFIPFNILSFTSVVGMLGRFRLLIVINGVVFSRTIPRDQAAVVHFEIFYVDIELIFYYYSVSQFVP